MSFRPNQTSLTDQILGFKLFEALNFRLKIALEINGMKKIDLYGEDKEFIGRKKKNIIENLRLSHQNNFADFYLVPHEWILIRNNSKYLKYLKKIAEDTPLLIFNTGDISPKITINNVIEMRTFLHPNEDTKNKIILPYPAIGFPLKLRKWKEIPTISFMGYVPKLSLGSLVGPSIKVLQNPIVSSPYLMRKISISRLKALEKNFEVSIVTRKTFTLYHKNPDLLSHMEEYSNQLMESDYVLCPRGFGNTSMRFYECLSAGRTPILPDSYSKLPSVTDNSNWETNIVKLPLFGNWMESIMQDWDSLKSANNYELRQIKNWKLFTNELEYTTYLTNTFKDYLI